MTSNFSIAVSNGLAVPPDQKPTCLCTDPIFFNEPCPAHPEQKCEDCRNPATDTFLGKELCKIHLMARELAEGL